MTEASFLSSRSARAIVFVAAIRIISRRGISRPDSILLNSSHTRRATYWRCVGREDHNNASITRRNVGRKLPSETATMFDARCQKPQCGSFPVIGWRPFARRTPRYGGKQGRFSQPSNARTYQHPVRAVKKRAGFLHRHKYCNIIQHGESQYGIASAIYTSTPQHDHHAFLNTDAGFPQERRRIATGQ